jgi:carbon monoxide dehydrogenase subunit G
MAPIRAETTIEIARSPAEVFSVLADVRRLPEWQSGCVAVTLESDGPLAVGSRFRQRITFAGKKGDQRVQVDELEPDRVLTLHILSGPLPVRARHVLEQTDGGTKLTVVMEGELGALGKLAGPLVRRAAEHQFEGWFRRLKALVESDAGRSSGDA